MGLHTTSTTAPKLNFHHKESQINLWCCLSNNIYIMDNNNKNNINNDKNKKNNINNNNNKTSLMGFGKIEINLVILYFSYLQDSTPILSTFF